MESQEGWVLVLEADLLHEFLHLFGASLHRGRELFGLQGFGDEVRDHDPVAETDHDPQNETHLVNVQRCALVLFAWKGVDRSINR